MSSGQWSRLRLPPTVGGIACHSSPMAHIVTMVVVDKTPRECPAHLWSGLSEHRGQWPQLDCGRVTSFGSSPK